MKIKSTKIKLSKVEIADQITEAIVNPVNTLLSMKEGISKILQKKAGIMIKKELKRMSPLKIGEVVISSAGGLSANYLIHVVIANSSFQVTEISLRKAILNTLKKAEEKKISSLCFPALGDEVCSFNLAASAKIMAQEIFKFFFFKDKSIIKEIVIALSKKEYSVFHQNFKGYLNYISRKIQQGPFITVDVIIKIGGGLLLIKRKNPPFGWALPGGFVDYGESLETAVRREAKEETGLTLRNLQQFHTYSQPDRDPRFHTISTVFTAEAKGCPKADTDAEELNVFKVKEIKNLNLAFDHKRIIKDYFKRRKV